MDIWYKCNCCGKEYPVPKLVRVWDDAAISLNETCQNCKRGTYIKVKK